MNKQIESSSKRIGEILIAMIVNVLVDSVGLYSAINLFFISFNISLKLTFKQAMAIILLYFVLVSIFGRKEKSE